MGILDEDVTRVRETTDIVSLIGEHVPLRRVGQRYSGLCPFHQEKSPSFSVNPALNLYHCFGCQRSGDAITFVREVEGLDFVEAVERLAQRAGITLRYDDRSQAKDRSRRGRLIEAVGVAVDFYHQRLLEGADGGAARSYLRSRAFDGDAARRFVLGWSPDDWDLLCRHLQQRKLSRDDIVGAGLGFVNKANRLQDQFRSRLMFPIYDARGEPVGFGGRLLSGEGPKYKNSPETPIYQKSRLLYGLNWAKSEVVARGDVIICEGYTDVMGFALAGAPNAVATCGTALADDHVRALKNLARKVTLAYDSDAAGQGAAEQWYRWEHEYEIQVQVADLPAGRDPGELWKEDAPRLLVALEQAKPFLQFRFDRVVAAGDTATPEGRARTAERAMAIVAEHPSELVRDQYAVQLSDQLGIDTNRIRDQIETLVRTPKALRPAPGPTRRERAQEPAPEEPPPSRVTAVDRREIDLLRWVIHEPELVADWIDTRLFADPAVRAAFDVLASHPDFHEALEGADGPVRALLQQLAVEEPVDQGFPETLSTRLLVTAVWHAADGRINAMLNERDERTMEYKPDVDTLGHLREVGDWDDARPVAERLLGWLVGEGGAT